MKKWYQKSMAVITAAACLFAVGTIGLARDSLPQLQLTAEAEGSTYIEAAYGLQLKYDYLSDGTIEITKFVSTTSSDIELPSVIDGKPVTSIANSAFYGCTSLTNVTISKNVTNIGDAAFYNCTNLKNVTIPESVTDIGAWAFFECNSLISIVIPENVECINNSTFYNCSSLKTVTLSDNLKDIGECVFQGCTSLKNITIPKSMTSISDNTFYNCSNLESVTIPKSITRIGRSVFSCCDNLTDIYYKGTESEWNQVSIGSSAIPSNTTIHYEYESLAIGNLEIAKVEVTLDELKANDYKVTVPINIDNNDDGWDLISFWAEWNINEIVCSRLGTGSVVDALIQDIEILNLCALNPAGTGCCVEYGTIPSGDSPNYVKGNGAIAYLYFDVNKNAQPGDIYYINGLEKSFDGDYISMITHGLYKKEEAPSQGYIKIVAPATTTTATTTTTTTTTTTKPTTTTTVTTTTTAAHTIAKSDDDFDTVAYGDINTDNAVDLRDAIILNKYLANVIQFSDVQMANADCYKDGNLDEKDASTLMQFVISLIQDIPVIKE